MRTEYIECDCHAEEHAIVFKLDIDPEFPEPDLYLTVFLERDTPFFRRVWTAFKYIFNIGKPSRYGHFQTTMLSRADGQRIAGLLAEYETAWIQHTEKSNGQTSGQDPKTN